MIIGITYIVVTQDEAVKHRLVGQVSQTGLRFWRKGEHEVQEDQGLHKDVSSKCCIIDLCRVITYSGL